MTITHHDDDNTRGRLKKGERVYAWRDDTRVYGTVVDTSSAPVEYQVAFDAMPELVIMRNAQLHKEER